DGAADRKERGHLWMARNDLRGYVLLGDPAVRLPLAQHALAAREPAPPAATASAGALLEARGGVGAEAGARPAGSSAPSLDAKIAAVHALLRGNEAPLAIAQRAGASLDELWGWFDSYRTAGRGALER